MPPAQPSPQRKSSETIAEEVALVIMASDGTKLPPTLQRAMSCDSVCSENSVDFQEPSATGYLCVGLEFDR